MKKIGFIGVGNMGNPMAVNLLKAGSKIKVFDVSKQMLEKAREKNLETVDRIEDLISEENSSQINTINQEQLIVNFIKFYDFNWLLLQIL